MRPFFLSYRRRPWMPEVLGLSAECRRRGIRTIVDVSDPEALEGQSQFDAIRELIRRKCGGFIPYMTHDVPESSCIWNVEIPAALESLDRGGFIVLPVFRNISPSEAKSYRPHGPRLSAVSGVQVGLPDGIDSAEEKARLRAVHREVATTALGSYLDLHAEEIGSDGLEIGITSRETGRKSYESRLLVDWAAEYDSLADGEDVDSTVVLSALHDLRRAVAKVNPARVRLLGPGHLSAALALGHAFHRATGISFEVAVDDAVWAVDGELGEAHVRIASTQVDPGHSEVVLIVGISRPEIVPDVDAALEGLNIDLGGRIVVVPAAGAGRQSVAGAPHARAIVRSTVDTLMNARAKWGTGGRVHIFMACPFPLAALLGHSLNGFGHIRTYEKVDGAARYCRALDLKDI